MATYIALLKWTLHWLQDSNIVRPNSMPPAKAWKAPLSVCDRRARESPGAWCGFRAGGRSARCGSTELQALPRWTASLHYQLALSNLG
jgi:hypothetical protein